MSRKQREIANRHNLFLEIGRGILEEDGFHLLSMEAIAEAAEYSKGTVYQHFSCKEEILIQLCIQEMTELQTLFLRASQFEGSNRDRIVAVAYAHLLWSRIGCKKNDMLQHLSMHGVRDKVSDSNLKQHDELHDSIVGLVNNIVNEAFKAGELNKSKTMLAPDIVFGLWSLFSGGQLLQTSELPLEEMGISDPNMTILRTMMLMLDGLNWQPRHTEAHLKKLLKSFNTQLFVEEYALASAEP